MPWWSGLSRLAVRYRIPGKARETAIVGIGGAVVLLVVISWPGYPFLELLSEGDVYDGANRVMYERPLVRIAPALVGAMVIAARSRRQWRDPLGLMLVGALGVYLLGWVTEQWTFGRMMAFAVLVMQIGLAAGVSDLERQGRLYRREAPWLSPALVGVTALLALGLITTAPGWVRGIPARLLPPDVEARFYRTPGDVASWERVLGGGVVVTPDRDAQEIAPAVGAKVIFTTRPLAYLADLEDRLSGQTAMLAGGPEAALSRPRLLPCDPCRHTRSTRRASREPGIRRTADGRLSRDRSRRVAGRMTRRSSPVSQ